MTQDNMIMYDQLVEQGIATPEEINLVFNVHGGDWTSVLNAILYVRTGYRSLQQMIDAEGEEEEDIEEVFPFEERECDYEPEYDLDCGFDPYMGCYTEDC